MSVFNISTIRGVPIAPFAPASAPSLAPSSAASAPILAPSSAAIAPALARHSAAAAATTDSRGASLRAAADAPRAREPAAAAVPPPPPREQAGTVTQQGVFVTPQTIANFAGATLAVSLMWKVTGVIRPGWEKEPLVGLIASVLVGVVLYLISETDPGRGVVTIRERMIGIFVALINTLVIFSAAVGAGGVTGSNGVQPIT